MIKAIYTFINYLYFSTIMLIILPIPSTLVMLKYRPIALLGQIPVIIISCNLRNTTIFLLIILYQYNQKPIICMKKK